MKIKIILTTIVVSFLSHETKSFTYKQLENEVLSKNTLIKVKKQEVLEVELKIKKERADLYPHINAVIGQEKLLAPNERQTENSKTVAEVRVDYELYQFGVTQKRIKALEETKKIKERSLAFIKDQLSRDLKRLYYSTLAIKKNLDLIEEEIKYNTKLKSQVSLKNKQGLVGAADKLEMDMREATLINTRIKLTEEYQHSLDRIRKISYISHDQEINLSGEIPHNHFDMNIEKLINSAKSNNIDLLNINTKMLALQNELDASFYERLPSLKLTSRFGNMRIDETYTSNQSSEGLIGIYFEMPLFDGGKRSANQQLTKTKLQKSKQAMIKTKHHLEIDLAHKFEKFQNIHKLLDLAEKNVSHAKKYFNNILGEYKRGIKNSLDLVSARDRLYQFQIDVINYKKEYQISKLDIERITSLNL
ncbi:MAG: hypothetical protein CME69_08085 [Halobacteriovorax sp.]|nr:hypothetical protein [Halobacteriovorax sp.]|tara:strand:+ start:1261 stop:2517 length:1257 start_codon:yes stop_codon:yes gene_type:complete